MKPTLDLASSPGAYLRPDEGGAAGTTVVEPQPSIIDGKRDGMPTSGSSLEEAINYSGKTPAIQRRYGPQPRVHHHAGLVDELEYRSQGSLRRG